MLLSKKTPFSAERYSYSMNAEVQFRAGSEQHGAYFRKKYANLKHKGLCIWRITELLKYYHEKAFAMTVKRGLWVCVELLM